MALPPAASLARAGRVDREVVEPRLGFGRIVGSESNRGTEYISEYGIKPMNGSTKRQCDRALNAPR